MYCPFKKNRKTPPCMIINVKKWGYLRDFLVGNNKGEEDISIMNKLGCAYNDGNNIKINQELCIGCLFCLVNCPENLLSIDDSLRPKEKCSDFIKDKDYRIKQGLLEDLLNRRFLKIASLGNVSVARPTKYNSFEDFGSVDETQNIAVWALSLIKHLSIDKFSQMGREINMIISNRDRGGRLDVCMLSQKKNLICIETKVNFDKMMQENRYVAQLIAYRQEISKTIIDLNLALNTYELLLIDGDETKLLFPSHPECSSRVGNQAEIFYNNIKEHNIFFISARALIALTLKKIFQNNEKYSIENILVEIVRNGNLGLLSGGIVTQINNKDYDIMPIDEAI